MKFKSPPFLFSLVFFAALALPISASACPMCRDTTAGSTAQARKALRIAIPMLAIPAIAIFGGALVIARKVTPGQR